MNPYLVDTLKQLLYMSVENNVESSCLLDLFKQKSMTFCVYKIKIQYYLYFGEKL